jgi:predicted nucleic acid-binding protein
MKFALDSNIILYFEGIDDKHRQNIAQHLVSLIGRPNLIVPIQALAECVNRLSKVSGWSRPMACSQMNLWFERFATQDTTRAVYGAAEDLSVRHGLQFFDSIILASAHVASADVLLSEDMQDGFCWRGVTIINPFAVAPNPLMRSMLPTKSH